MKVMHYFSLLLSKEFLVLRSVNEWKLFSCRLRLETMTFSLLDEPYPSVWPTPKNPDKSCNLNSHDSSYFRFSLSYLRKSLTGSAIFLISGRLVSLWYVAGLTNGYYVKCGSGSFKSIFLGEAIF
jgi:hypothetical protein